MLSKRVCMTVIRDTLIPSVEYLSDQVGTNKSSPEIRYIIFLCFREIVRVVTKESQ